MACNSVWSCSSSFFCTEDVDMSSFDPIFVLPVANPTPLETSPLNNGSPITHTPGRRTGTGSANVQSAQARVASTRQPILGFHQVSLLTIIGLTGLVPTSYFRRPNTKPLSLNDIRTKAARPVVVFPECTTSNGRGLLRFSNVFNEQIPPKNYQVFIMCVRYVTFFLQISDNIH